MTSKLIEASHRLTLEITSDDMTSAWIEVEEGAAIAASDENDVDKTKFHFNIAALAGGALVTLRELATLLDDTSVVNIIDLAIGLERVNRNQKLFRGAVRS
jgi:hypothetical protein